MKEVCFWFKDVVSSVHLCFDTLFWLLVDNNKLRDYHVDCQGANRGIFTNLRDRDVQKIHNQQLQFTSGGLSFSEEVTSECRT